MERRAKNKSVPFSVGAAIGGGSGAATAPVGEQFNRQLHPEEVDWVKQNADLFAQQLCGCSNPTPEQVEDAQNRLMAQAFTLVDENAVHLSQANSEWDGYFDNQAADYLFDHPAQFTWGQGFVPDEHFSDPHYNGDLLASDTDAFRDAMNGMILGSNVPRTSLQETYGEEFLRWGGAQVGESGKDLTLVVGGSALAGGGTAFVASGGIAATTAAGRAIWAGLPSLGQAALSGGAGSGALYWAGAVTGAGYDAFVNHKPFWEGYSERFSWSELTISAGVGAAGGMYTRQMLTWAGLPLGLWPSLQTAGGVVIRGNQQVLGQTVSRSLNSAVESQSEKDNGEGKP